MISDTPDDESLWWKEVADCTKITSARRSRPQKRDVFARRLEYPQQRYFCPSQPLPAEKVLSYSNKDIQIVADYRKENPLTTVDLHGMTTREAHQFLEERLSSLTRPHLCLQIIHGQGQSQGGMSIMKAWLACYLQDHPYCYKYSSCPQNLGGTGAVLAWFYS